MYQRVLDIAPLAANWKGLEGGSAMTNSLSELDTAHPTGCTTGIPSRAIPCMTYYGSLNCNVRDPAQCDAVRAEFMDTVRAGDAATLALEDDATGTEVFHPTFEMTTNGGFHLVFNGDVIVQQCDSSVPVPTAGVLSAAQATTELVRQATAGTLSVQEDTTTSGGFPMRRTVVMGKPPDVVVSSCTDRVPAAACRASSVVACAAESTPAAGTGRTGTESHCCTMTSPLKTRWNPPLVVISKVG